MTKINRADAIIEASNLKVGDVISYKNQRGIVLVELARDGENLELGGPNTPDLQWDGPVGDA